jgi:type VI secretion system protein ImpG
MASMRQYYEAQLKFLREQGKRFAAQYPQLAPFLAAGDLDPDVERLLEGFAFISAQLWHKIDDAYPELSEQLLQFLAPYYLKPLPACSVLEFLPRSLLLGRDQWIARGTRIRMMKAQKPYFFSTCYDTQLLPMTIKNITARHELHHMVVKLDCSMLGTAHLSALPATLRLYLAADLNSAYEWYYLLLQQLQRVCFHVADKNIDVIDVALVPVGFGPEASLLPFSDVKQHLIEYYAFPEKFMFIDIKNLPWTYAPYAQEFSLEFYLKVPEALKLTVSPALFKLNCTPIINLYEDDAAPITHDHQRNRYLVQAALPEANAAVHSILALDAWSETARRVYHYHAAYDCPYLDANGQRFQVYSQISAVGSAPEIYLELWEQKLTSIEKIIIVPKVLLYQPEAFLEVCQGDIADDSQNLLACGYRNIKPLSRPFYPPLGQNIAWHLLCYLALAYKNMDTLVQLKTLLMHHDFSVLQSEGQRLTEAMHAFIKEKVVRFEQGEAVRGFKHILSLRESAFLNHGEIYLLGSIIAHIFQDRSEINGFHELEIRGVETGLQLRF